MLAAATPTASLGTPLLVVLAVAILGGLAGLASVLRVRTQNRTDRATSAETVVDGAYKRISAFTDTLTHDRDYWQAQAATERTAREAADAALRAMTDRAEAAEARAAQLEAAAASKPRKAPPKAPTKAAPRRGGTR